jgi:5-methylcytosine-specific restriction endonuclease McrA
LTDARSVPEWVGKTSDTPIPQRVRIRVFERNRGICQCGCTRRIWPGQRWETDHIVAIINGGENREKNLQTLLGDCHDKKTGKDVAQKSKTYERKLMNHGIKKKRGPPMPGSKRSKWKRRMDGSVVRR